ncbi:MAG: phosphotransferase [Bacteroidales bacterium]|nr:phosphotransferase [Bacteroidales bacterium]
MNNFPIDNQISLLKTLFKKWSGENANQIHLLPSSGSNRKYFRIKSSKYKALGVFNNNLKENKAFIEFSKHFKKHFLNVPEIYYEDLENNIYLIEDFGDIDLFSLIKKDKNKYSTEIINIFKKILTELIKFQLTAGKDINYNLCYPRKSFDKQSMLWDLNYFKYYFLKFADISLDEQELENDFHSFINILLKADNDYFMYRDFQSRNILICENSPCFIDYQGGRKGALQYDVASLLFQVRAEMPNNIRENLLDYYIEQLKNSIDVDEKEFKKYYYAFVYLRLMQVMGAYGFRGLYEKKAHFVQSIPFAIKNLKWMLKNHPLPEGLSELNSSLNKLSASDKFDTSIKSQDKLRVSVNSFSFKKAPPTDMSGNGGGFTFDCRALPNPGRYEKYRSFTGRDKIIIDYLEKEKEVKKFENNVFKVVEQPIEKYLERGFTNLMINFGCTGGQHRSVFFAEKLTKHIKSKYQIEVVLKHCEKESWNIM